MTCIPCALWVGRKVQAGNFGSPLAEFTRRAIDDAQCTEFAAIRRFERAAGIEADVWLTCDVWVIVKSFVDLRVGNQQNVVAKNRMAAKGYFSRALGAFDPLR